jgi:subtilisin family serine protease
LGQISTRSVVATVAVGLWAVAVTVALDGAAWLGGQLLAARPVWLWPLAGLLAGVLTGGPALVLALLPGSPVIRATGRVWALGALALAVLSLARAVPEQHNWAYLLVLSLPGLAFVRPRGSWRALTGGLAALLPWLCLTALGGLVETVAAVVAAASVGALAARILDHAELRLRALVAVVALTLVAGGTGTDGAALAALVALPLLGLVVPLADLRRWRPAAAVGGSPPSGGTALLVGLGALGPLAFVEPVQTQLVLGLDDEPRWVLVAAVLAALAGPLGALLPLPRVTAGVLAVASVLGYAVVGHPGLYGDELFVVMRSRADLANLPADLTARRTEVYRRLVETADRSQAPLRHDLSRLHLAYTPFYLVNGIEVDGGPEVRAWLSTRSDVDRVLLNPRLRPLPAPPSILSGQSQVDGRPQWTVTSIGADRVWATGDTGQGIVVGSSDSGVDGTHPVLRNGFRGGDDSWYDPGGGTRSPTDYGGHGTHTLGSAVGGNGIGVAPGARWIGCVNLPRNLGSPAGYLRCLQYLLAPFRYGGNPLRDGHPARAADVLVNSWGCPPEEGCDADALGPAVDALTAAGILVTAAAGNDGSACATVTDPPATYPSAVTVGAVDRHGAVAPFSSRGNGKPELVAPGVDVTSALPGGTYGTLSGTSMATPQVAGVVALMWAANPKLRGNPGATKALLRQTGTPVDDGCGQTRRVDADAAVQAARKWSAG